MKPVSADPAADPAPGRDPDEIAPEYDFRGARPNPYAARYGAGARAVVLEPDVAAAFPDAAEVNAVLRAAAALIRAHEGARGPGRAGADAAAA
ncbi:MAG TPA: hypothetical protein VGD56_19635 [Gemmatirosa sp.]